jgi:hypothetical protein
VHSHLKLVVHALRCRAVADRFDGQGHTRRASARHYCSVQHVRQAEAHPDSCIPMEHKPRTSCKGGVTGEAVKPSCRRSADKRPAVSCATPLHAPRI